MAQETRTKAQLWAELDALGEETVREHLLMKVYGDVGHKRVLVEEWLRIRETSRASEIESRSATRQTIAATAATVAAIAATIGAIVSIISLLSR